ncbi:MAG: hypothetical protein DRO18_00710 [Thermoprotei archaeon]|nr:MAG: hypothetical protein DRO18_00710 [Thermoprotei archaeon]
MRRSLIIVKKELVETLRDRATVSSYLFVGAFLMLFNSTTFKGVINVEAFTVYLAPVVGVAVGFNLANRFVREKGEGVLETLLCSPLTLTELWLGKVVGLLIPSYIASLISVMVIGIARGLTLDAPLLIYITLVTPAFIASVIGLLGCLYWILGMREVRILNYVVFFTLSAVMFIVLRFVNAMSVSIELGYLVITATSLAMLSLATCLMRYISKERLIKP